MTPDGKRSYRAAYGLASSSGKEVVYWKKLLKKMDGSDTKDKSGIMNEDLEARINKMEAERSQTTTHNALESMFVQLSVFSFQPFGAFHRQFRCDNCDLIKEGIL